ncbi:MAG: hypothetical protein QXE10_02340 [Desulfurococcaceae archaeon]
MWAIALLLISALSTIAWFKTRAVNKYRFDLLAVISGSAGLMFLVDNIYSYLNEGVLFEFNYDAVLLTITLVISALLTWLAILIYSVKFKQMT